MVSEPLSRVALGLAVALSASLLFMPIAIAVGKRFRLLVKPRLFGRNGRSVPYLGGLAVGLATWTGFVVGSGLPKRVWPLLVGGLLGLALGLADDRSKTLSGARWFRLLLQFGVAFAAWFTGMAADTPGVLGQVGTILFLVAAMNAFNLLDNMDGVAGWTAFGTAAGIGALALMTGQHVVAALAACLCGACLGFLRYNFPHARIYLGNGGSLLVGFLLGALALKLRLPLEGSWGLLAIVVLLAVPATDTSVAIASRLLHGKSVLQGGTDHISHRLVRLGLRKRRAAVAHGLASFLAAGSVAVATFGGWEQLMILVVGLFAVAGLSLLTVRVYEQKGRGLVRRVALAAGLLLAGALGMAAPSALAARGNLEQARLELLAGARAAANMDFAAARTSFDSAEKKAERAERQLGSPLVWPARLVPLAGHNLRAVRALASGASYLAPAAREAVDALENLDPAGGKGGLSFADGNLTLDPISEVQGELKSAAASARFALKRAEKPSAFLLPPVGAARKAFIEHAQQAAGGFEKASQAAELLPPLMGGSGPRTYFLMIQNATEQRATGGFLGAFAILKADGGRLTIERLESNQALPEGLEVSLPSDDFAQRYEMFASHRIWQNVNMTPNFPTAARMAAQMWEGRTGQRVDGVMAVDAVALANLLAATGPVSVPDWPEPLTQKNFVRIALNEAYVRYPQKAGRVDFLLGAGQQILGRLFGPGSRDVRSLSQSIVDSFPGGHIQIWTRQEEEALRRLGIDGSLKPSKDSDYLFLVGQNAAGNKVDYYARREIDYRVQVKPDGRVYGRASVVLENKTPARGLPKYITGPYPTLPDAPGLNRSYVSLYLGGGTVASAARVDGKETTVHSHAELGRDIVSRMLEVLPGESSRFQVDLRPKVRAGGEYRLFVQRQPGINPDAFKLSVRLPPGAVVKGMTSGMRRVGDVVRWEGRLDADKEFFVSFGTSAGDRLQRLLTLWSSKK